MPFKNKSLKVESVDGRNFTLLEPLVYEARNGEVITIPVGAATDGASTPQAMWNVLPPFGKYWMAAVLHDGLYRLMKQPKARCDDLLLEAMLSLGVDEREAGIIYAGIKVGGWASFEEDRAEQHG